MAMRLRIWEVSTSGLNLSLSEDMSCQPTTLCQRPPLIRVGHLFCSFIPNLFRSPTVIPWYVVWYIPYITWIALYNTLFMILCVFIISVTYLPMDRRPPLGELTQHRQTGVFIVIISPRLTGHSERTLGVVSTLCP